MSKKILFALTFCVSLTACNKQEEAPAAETASTEAVPATEAAAAADLPQACTDYIARAEACFAKAAPEAAEMMKTSFDTTVAEWKKVEDKSVLGDACKAANDAFGQIVSALSCE